MTKANWQMLLAVLSAAILPAATVLVTGGIWIGNLESDMEHMGTEHIRRIQAVEDEQATVTDMKVEAAKTSVAVEGLQEDVGEIKDVQERISSAVEQSRREVNRLGREQTENFKKLMEALGE